MRTITLKAGQTIQIQGANGAALVARLTCEPNGELELKVVDLNPAQNVDDWVNATHGTELVVATDWLNDLADYDNAMAESESYPD